MSKTEQGTDQGAFYRHSGRSGLAIPLFVLVGFPLSAFFAVIYTNILVYSVKKLPVLGYLSWVFLIGYVLATGFALAYLAKLAKARNARVLFGLGCLAGFVGLYFSWLFFFRADYGMEFPLNMVLQVGSNPSQLWELIGEVNKSGWWAGGPSGILQWLVTAIEGIFFVLGVGILTSGSLDRRVFCEACDQWLKPAAVSHLRFTGEMADKFDKDDEEADFDHLEILRLPETSEEEVPRFEAETLECAGCGAKAVRLKLLAHQESDDGEMGLEEIDLPGVLFQSASGDAQAS